MVLKCSICKKVKGDTEYSRTQITSARQPKCRDCISQVKDHVCKICSQLDEDRALSIDHDHKTGFIRGRLCRNCNLGLGMFQDSIPILERAIKYLKESKDLQGARRTMERLANSA